MMCYIYIFFNCNIGLESVKLSKHNSLQGKTCKRTTSSTTFGMPDKKYVRGAICSFWRAMRGPYRYI